MTLKIKITVTTSENVFRIIKRACKNVQFDLFFSASDFADVSADAFNAMLGDVDLESDAQAGLAQDVLQEMLLGPKTTMPAIPTRTPDPNIETTSTTTTPEPKVTTSTTTTTEPSTLGMSHCGKLSAEINRYFN